MYALRRPEVNLRICDRYIVPEKKLLMMAFFLLIVVSLIYVLACMPRENEKQFETRISPMADHVQQMYRPTLKALLGNGTEAHPASTVLPVQVKQVEPVSPTASNHSKVIILTYMRSGSSLTGDLLQQNPNVFYFYEPLWSLEHRYNIGSKQPQPLLNGSSFILDSRKKLWYQKLHTMKHILNCDFMKVDFGSMTQAFFTYSKTTIQYTDCINRIFMETDYVSRNSLVECIQQFSSNCSNHAIRMIKVIRADMAQAQQLMAADPNVKIIHLVRDPRAKLLSEKGPDLFQLNRRSIIEQYAFRLCHQIGRNIEISKKIFRKDPGRILTVRYEDIVKSPIEATKQMYKFLGLKMTPEIQNYVWNITYAGNPDNCFVCTTRTNATKTAYAWRRKIRYSALVSIDTMCGKVMDVLGYRQLKSNAELTDSSFSTTIEIKDQELMILKDVVL